MRLLVIGHGLIGAQRAAAAAALASRGVTLVGTVDPRPRAKDLACPHYPALERVPADGYDAAVIALPHRLIKEMALSVLASGKPVLIEKPLGMNLAEARQIVAASKTVRKPSFVGYNYRYLPTVRAVFDRHASGYFGDLRSVDLLLGHGAHADAASEWKLQPEAAGGGVLIDPGVHLLDLLLCLRPELTCRSVVATRGFWKTGIEEDVCATLTEGRSIATVRVSIVRWINTFRIEIFGEDGYTIVEGRGGTYGPQTVRFGRRWGWAGKKGMSQRETEETFDFGPANLSLADELADIVDVWRGAAPRARATTMDEALRVAALCEQMYGVMTIAE